MDKSRLINAFEELSIYEYIEINILDILFEDEIVKMCSLNTCGFYNRNYSCPPSNDFYKNIKNQIQKYEGAFIFNKIIEIEDFKEINKTIKEFNILVDDLRVKFIDDDVIVLGIGPCRRCEKCKKIDELPCAYPNNINYSIEGSGINISKMAYLRNMTYSLELNQITYYGIVVF